MAWQDLPLPEDADTITESILTGLSERIDGWTPNEGSPEVAIAEEFAVQLAATNQLAIGAAQYIAIGIATTFGFAPVEGVAATLPDVSLTMQLPPSTATAPFTQAMLVPEGFRIAVEDHAFQIPANVAQDVSFIEVASGPQAGYWQGTFTADFVAIDLGTDSNVGTAGDHATILTASANIVDAVLTEGASGGLDEETLVSFLSRFTSWVSTIRPGGVRAADVTKLAATVLGVQRALAIDLYNPAAPGTPAERTVTVVPVDVLGQPLSSGTKTALETELESIREVNFIFHVIDPTYTNVAVAAVVVAQAGVDKPTINAAVTAAVKSAISPANWGTVANDPSTWTEQTTLRVLDIALAISTVPNIASITSITINGGTADITLTGPGALPTAVKSGGSTLAVTVN